MLRAPALTGVSCFDRSRAMTGRVWVGLAAVDLSSHISFLYRWETALNPLFRVKSQDIFTAGLQISVDKIISIVAPLSDLKFDIHLLNFPLLFSHTFPSLDGWEFL